ncbi:MAG: hypothetical protein H5T66_06305, partial [Chloroflexi bacterium]|nr:hypothetical protein [Chloroflexota bacterium]
EALLTRADQAPLIARLLRQFKTPTQALERNRLAMLAWLVATGWLEIRVGVMRRTGGILHAKFGLVGDAQGDWLAFFGSSNETGQALVENYEHLTVASSWQDAEYVRYYQECFDQLWADRDPEVTVISLPEAVRQELIRLAPQKPPSELYMAPDQARAAMLWRYIAAGPYLPQGELTADATAFVTLWPHQRRVVEETAAAFPAGRLLCDEVGLGKTIEAILVLRRLIAGRGVARALLLVPAGLVRQWQAELREKGGLLVPYWERGYLVQPDGSKAPCEAPAALAQNDLLLLSREWARLPNNRDRLLAAPAWDLVLMDEAHAARRSAQDEREFNSANLLLQLLRELQLRRKARGILLLSATPMQTQPWEPWDLLTVLGVGGPWMADFADIRAYYDGIAALQAGRLRLASAQAIAALLTAHDELNGQEVPLPLDSASATAQALMHVRPAEQDRVSAWLQRSAPLGSRMHRNTRNTLRGYYAKGLLPAPPPRRQVRDVLFDYAHAGERDCYEAITRYINRRYEELERERSGKGFVMTIYRRRASSSPYALRRSLERRLEALKRVAQRHWGEDSFSYADEQLDLQDLIEADLDERLDAALPTDITAAAREAQEVEELLERLNALGNTDSKLEKFWHVLSEITADGRAALVFTEYVDTMMYLREQLAPTYGRQLGCYSGDGGQVWDGDAWVQVSKGEITRRLTDGELRILVCTDAASEGLNLQAASALVNYDLPWNPSKVEQRIGRIDRIGQKMPEVLVCNMFLNHSVDLRVYELLHQRCGLFEHFVGKMQPVLSLARAFLRANPTQEEIADILRRLQEEAQRVEADSVASHAFVEADVHVAEPPSPPITRRDLEIALEALTSLTGGIRARPMRQQSTWQLIGLGRKYSRITLDLAVLESDPSAMPLTVPGPIAEGIAKGLPLPSRMPLVLGEYAAGPYRAIEVRWVGDGQVQPIASAQDLRERIQGWLAHPQPAPP